MKTLSSFLGQRVFYCCVARSLDTYITPKQVEGSVTPASTWTSNNSVFTIPFCLKSNNPYVLVLASLLRTICGTCCLAYNKRTTQEESKPAAHKQFKERNSNCNCNCFSNLLLVARRDTCLGVDLTLYSMLFLLLPLSFKAELLIYTLCIGCEKVLNCIQKEIVFLLNQLVMCIARYLLPNRRE